MTKSELIEKFICDGDFVRRDIIRGVTKSYVCQECNTPIPPEFGIERVIACVARTIGITSEELTQFLPRRMTMEGPHSKFSRAFIINALRITEESARKLAEEKGILPEYLKNPREKNDSRSRKLGS